MCYNHQTVHVCRKNLIGPPSGPDPVGRQLACSRGHHLSALGGQHVDMRWATGGESVATWSAAGRQSESDDDIPPAGACGNIQVIFLACLRTECMPPSHTYPRRCFSTAQHRYHISTVGDRLIPSSRRVLMQAYFSGTSRCRSVPQVRIDVIQICL